jgi:branched-chain amino acid transport system ATP-binding protein
MNILTLTKINTFYCLSHILFDMNMGVEEGSITGLLGRNGSGKTTTLRTIVGLAPPKTGSIRFREKDITHIPGYQVARKGIAYVPDDRQIFAPLSVYENLIIGIPKKNRNNRPGWTIDGIYQLFPVLKRMAEKGGTQISGGEQKMLAIGRALMCDPSLLLLDEPTEGLAPLVVNTLAQTTLKIGKRGLTILVADQNVNFARKIIGYGYIIDKGCIGHHGPMEEIWNDKELVNRYLAV